MSRPPRPYIRSSLRINYNIETNSIGMKCGGVNENLTERLRTFLVDAGFLRRKVKKRRSSHKGDQMEIDTKPTDKEIVSITNESLKLISQRMFWTEVVGLCSEDRSMKTVHEKDLDNFSESRSKKKEEFAVIGMRSILRALSHDSNKLGAVLLDADVVNVTAVAQIFALAAFNSESRKCPFYVIPELSNAIAKSLNLPRITIIGVFAHSLESTEGESTLKLKANEVLESLKNVLRPIELTTSTKRSSYGSIDTLSNSFTTPVLAHTKGKTGRAKKMKR